MEIPWPPCFMSVHVSSSPEEQRRRRSTYGAVSASETDRRARVDGLDRSVIESKMTSGSCYAYKTIVLVVDLGVRDADLGR